MKGLRFFLVLVMTVLMLGVFGGAMKKTIDYLESQDKDLDKRNLAVLLEEECVLYLSQAKQDQEFKVCADGSAPGVVILDADGNAVPYRYRQLSDGTYVIQPPEGGYSDLRQYEMLLQEGTTFADADMQEAKKLNFSIAREEQFSWELTPEVRESARPFDVLDEQTISLETTGGEYSPGEILFYADGEESEAYKIIKINPDGTAIVETPELEEIFSDIQVYGSYVPDFTNAEVNEQMAEQISQNFRNSDFYKNLMIEAYAADFSDIKIKITEGLVKVVYCQSPMVRISPSVSNWNQMIKGSCLELRCWEIIR